MSTRRILLYGSLIGAGVFSISTLGLYLLQNKIIYPSSFPDGQKRLEDNPRGYVHPRDRNLPCSSVQLQAKDKVAVNGWLLLHENSFERPTVLFFHANAGNRGYRMDFIEQFFVTLKLNVFIIDYRGYGESDDPVSESGIKLDAESSIEHLQSLPEINPDSIYVFGRSLGGAVAIYIAHKYRVKGLILENTFTSLPDVLRSYNFYLALCAKFLLRSIWNSLSLIGQVRCPILFISGAEDSLIPPWQMRSLYEHASGAEFKEFEEVEGADHNDTWTRAGTNFPLWIERFIKRSSD